MKKITLLLSLFIIGLISCNAQIISQYIETNSGTTPKGIEIWNNTESELDFSTNNLVIKKGSNGGALETDVTIATGTLASGAVMVIGTSDMENQVNGAVYVEKSFNFNGDDALSVEYGGTVTDVFGEPGTDPGSAWSSGDVSTANKNIKLIEGSIVLGDLDGWTDPSERFEYVASGTDLTGFGIAPTTVIGGAGSLTISNVLPIDGTEVLVNTPFTVSAIVNTSEGNIDSVRLAYGTETSNLADTILMSRHTTTTDSFYVQMDMGETGTYYGQVIAYGSNGEVVTSSVISVVAIAPQVTDLPYTEDFSDGFGKCYVYDVSGASETWEISSGSAYINGYNSAQDQNDWLVLPGIDLDAYINEVLTFTTKYNYGSEDESNYLKLYYSTDYAGLGNPSAATWNELSFTSPSSVNTETASGDVDLSSINGDSVYLAFQYLDANDGSYRSWYVDNISISGQDTSSTAPYITAITPADNYTITVGDTLTITATVEISIGTVDSVLVIAGESVDNMPYSMPLIYNSSLTCWMVKNKITSTNTMLYKFVAYGNGKTDTSAVQSLIVECGTVTAPTAIAATNIATTSFTANWNAVTEADHYLLSVWSVEGTAEVVYASSEFDDGVSPFPSEWTKNTKVYTTTVGNEGTYGLKLGSSSAAGEVTSPTFSTTEDFSVVFYGQEYDSDEQSITVAYGSQSKTISTLNDTWAEFVVNFTAESGENAVSFSAKRAYLDEVTIKSGGYTITYILQNENVSTNSKSVTGLISDSTYYYSVVAVNQYGCESDTSNHISVTTDIVTGLDEAMDKAAHVFTTDGAIVVETEGVQQVEVYDIVGRRVAAFAVDSKGIVGVKSGIYLVRVADVVTKVAVE